MAKKVYYVKAKFKTFIELNDDYSAEEKAEVIEAVNYLPQCQFEFGIGGSFLQLYGTGAYCQGQISSKEVGKLQEVTFDGCFLIDPKARRDKADG